MTTADALLMHTLSRNLAHATDYMHSTTPYTSPVHADLS